MINLKAFRETLGLSGEQFVESLKDYKVSRTTLVAYENGDRSAPEEFKEAVSVAYPEMAKEDIFGYDRFNVPKALKEIFDRIEEDGWDFELHNNAEYCVLVGAVIRYTTNCIASAKPGKKVTHDINNDFYNAESVEDIKTVLKARFKEAAPFIEMDNELYNLCFAKALGYETPYLKITDFYDDILTVAAFTPSKLTNGK